VSAVTCEARRDCAENGWYTSWTDETGKLLFACNFEMPSTGVEFTRSRNHTKPTSQVYMCRLPNVIKLVDGKCSVSLDGFVIYRQFVGCVDELLNASPCPPDTKLCPMDTRKDNMVMASATTLIRTGMGLLSVVSATWFERSVFHCLHSAATIRTCMMSVLKSQSCGFE
jgi:hypothetical protein